MFHPHHFSVLRPLLHLVIQSGPWAYLIIFCISVVESIAAIGLIIPGTTIIVFSGFLVWEKALSWAPLLAVLILGGIIGDGLSFLLGRSGISWFKHDHPIFKLAYLEKGEKFFKKHGEKSVVIARFVGPLRPFIPFIAGLFKMDIRRFFFYNIFSAIISAVVFIAIGFFFGRLWKQAEFFVGRMEGGIILMAGILIFGYFVRKKFLEKRERRRKNIEK